LGGALLAGCNIGIQAPVDKSTHPSTTPVGMTVILPLAYETGTFQARLPDRDITNSFTVDAQNRSATASLTMMPGTYPLTVDACWRLKIFFVQQPPWPMSGCSSAISTFSVVKPSLELGPSGLSVNVGAPTPTDAEVSVNIAPTAQLTVNLSTTPTSRLTTQASTSIAAGTLGPVKFPLQGVSPGTASLTAKATGFDQDVLTVNVRPVVTGFCPSHAPPGAAVRIIGAGFVAPMSVKFGTAPAVQVTPTSTAEINLTVPGSLTAGTPTVTVTSNGQTSLPLSFTVTSGPLLLRATNDKVEQIRFNPGATFSAGSFQLLGSTSATLSPGTLSVGLARTCDQVARGSASDAQLFDLGGTATAPTLTLKSGIGTGGGLTGTGTAIDFLANLLVRGTNTGIETIDPATSPMSRLGGANGAGSPTGVATVTLAGSPARVFRSHGAGIDVYDISPSGIPIPGTNLTAGMSASAAGSALAWITPGSQLVRATSGAIEVIDVSGSMLTPRGANTSGGLSSSGVAVAVTGDRAVRGTSTGVEVYEISTPTAPQRCAFRNAAGSSTGVGVVIVGMVAFRATNNAMEAYDISGVMTTCPTPPSGTIIPAPVSLTAGLGLSSTGVALVGP
jgi:hypothetical protein